MDEDLKLEPWIAYVQQRPHARLRLFCFHYAGAGASVFRDWVNELPQEIGIHPVQLPGRENRFTEPLFTEMHLVVTALERALAPYFDLPFAFFGHSMGALIAFELIRRLRKVKGPLPSYLFVSGRRAPQLPSSGEPMHNLPRSELMKRLHELEGMPTELLAQEGMMDWLLPIIRADFMLCEKYQYAEEEPFDLPLTVFGGADDSHVDPTELAAWFQHTRGSCRLLILPGNHFFLQTARKQLIKVIVNDIRELISFRPLATNTHK